MATFIIDVVSDAVCPWCYVGFKRLNSAIALHKTLSPASTFTINWHPFYLNPSAPNPSVDKRTYITAKFGAERTTFMQSHLDTIGRSVGINFSHGGRTGNTRDAHRLVYLAAQKQRQGQVVERLFKAYFEEEKDITDRGVLAELAAEAGLEGGEVSGWLEGEEGGREVDKEVEEARGRGVRGVPNFTVNGKWVLGGAQEEKEFLEVFEEAAKDAQK